MQIQVCKWVGDGEGCRHPTIYGKAYCEQHHERMYDTYLPEMADYVLNKELNANRTLAERE
jgi:hypothetical protein